MEENKIDFDMSSLSLQELIKTYESINSFLEYLEENKVEEGDEKSE